MQSQFLIDIIPAMEREHPKNLSPKEQLQELLANGPSGPDFTQSTLNYCDKAIEASLTLIEGKLRSKHPQIAPVISQVIEKLTHLQIRNLPPSDLEKKGEKISVKTPKGGILPANFIAKVLYTSESQLGRFDYIMGFFVPNPKYPNQGKYIGFNLRLQRFAQVANLDTNNPIMQLMAAAYITQAAKNSATDASRALARKTISFGGIEQAIQLEPFLKQKQQEVEIIRRHQLYIKKGLETINNICKEHNLDENQLQLVMDIAFIKNKGLDSSKEFTSLLDPLLKLIIENQWEAAYKHRDFLLRFFGNSFPNWRSRRFREQTDEESFDTIKDLAKAINEGKIVLDTSEIPQQYQDILKDTLATKVESARRNKDKQILIESVDFSNIVLLQLKKKMPRVGVNLAGWIKRAVSVKEVGGKHLYWFINSNRNDLLFNERDFRNFGNLICRVIQKCPNEAATIFYSAYEQALRKNPNLKLSLKQYLTAIVRSSTIKDEETLEEITARIKEIKEPASPALN